MMTSQPVISAWAETKLAVSTALTKTRGATRRSLCSHAVKSLSLIRPSRPQKSPEKEEAFVHSVSAC